MLDNFDRFQEGALERGVANDVNFAGEDGREHAGDGDEHVIELTETPVVRETKRRRGLLKVLRTTFCRQREGSSLLLISLPQELGLLVPE
jgi:hypothetical protein